MRRIAASLWQRARHLNPIVTCCALCGDRALARLAICQGCLDDLPINHNPCPRCALPQRHDTKISACGHCLRKPPKYDQMLAPYSYEAPCDHIIGQLKFNQSLHMAPLMGRLLVAYLRQQQIPRPDLIVPTPLHSARLRERGFNHAHTLAKVVAQALQCPVHARAIMRTRSTAVQSSLSARLRQRNVRGAFCVTDSVAGKHLALIDDVVTTSATASELARVLKLQGASSVTVWAFARAATR